MPASPIFRRFQPGTEDATGHHESTEHGDEHGGEHGFHANFLGVFVGFTGEERRERAFTLGIEYERRINESFGIGGVLEHAFGDEDFTVGVIPFAWHINHWKLYAGPGFEKSRDHDAELLGRIGVEYAFESGNMEIAPQVNVDFVDGEAVFVLGLVIGKGY